jgi:hypothetical protein
MHFEPAGFLASIGFSRKWSPGVIEIKKVEPINRP